MTLEVILDRVEENKTAVLTDSDGRCYECQVTLLTQDAKENDAFAAELDEAGEIISLTPRENKQAGENKTRLRALFNKNKN